MTHLLFAARLRVIASCDTGLEPTETSPPITSRIPAWLC